MAVDLIRLSKIDDRMAMEKAASAGLQSMEHLIRVLSSQTPSQSNLDCREITDFTVAKFKQFISVLNRTGHARFRRGPAQQQPTQSSPPAPTNPVPPKPQVTMSFETGNPNTNTKTKTSSKSKDLSLSPPMSTTSSFLSSVTTGDGSVSNGKVFSSAAVPPAPTFSAGKPPLSQSHRKRCHDELATKTTSGPCHCSKRRKSKVKRTVRVPAVSSKIADIPSDEFSWRKYGQKPIKGSPYPRGYYKCSSVRGCPARKHVERAQDDPTMLIVTYEAEHRHPHPDPQANSVPAGVVGLVFQSA